MNIYVGNLSYSTSDDDLREAFERHGAVDSARVITDRETGRSRGFGFVEMPNSGEAQAAINAMNGADLQGRSITANEARPRERSGGGGGGGRSGGGGGGGYRSSRY
ncbi:MAG: RNA-binding protein [Candidatus Hydrogenedentes bacterium]|nr:RNA-binding protein [Candidatus Hydrogenedentota bacterium]